MDRDPLNTLLFKLRDRHRTKLIKISNRKFRENPQNFAVPEDASLPQICYPKVVFDNLHIPVKKSRLIYLNLAKVL